MGENNTMTEQQDQKNEFLLEVNNLKQYFPNQGGSFAACCWKCESGGWD